MSSPTRQPPYLRLWRVAPTKIYSPGSTDVPAIPPPATGVVQSILSRVRMVSTFSTGNPTDPFVLRTTMPALANPLAPTGTDNVGWDGNSSGGTFNTLVTIPSGGVRTNCVFNCDVIMPADGSGRLDNCMIYGGPPQTNRAGAVTANGGGNIVRCTFYGQPGSVAYYRNGINHSGGVLNVTRTAFYRWIDMIHSTGGTVNTAGCLYDRFAFFNNDADHASGTPAYWTHNDAVQHLAGGGAHTHIGDLVWSRYDTTGMTWSGTPGASTASGGEIGMPSVAANAGYWNTTVGGNYGNGYMFSNVSGQIATIEDVWIEGGNNPSALISFTTGTTNQPTLNRIKFGVGGYRTALVRYLVSYPTGTTVVQSGNVFAGSYFPSVPTALRGTPVTVTSGGMRYTA